MRKLPKKIQEQLTYSYPGDKFVKRPKYSNRSCKCWDQKHAPHGSILEADLCNQLSLMKKSGEVKYYVTQYPIVLVVGTVKICTHIVDFMVEFKDRSEFWEAKGMELDVWKLKRKLTEALWPEIKYVVKYEKPSFFKGKR